jgi:hypothetical protein
VDPGEQGYMTVTEPSAREYADVPVIEVESFEDIEDIVYDTKDVMDAYTKSKTFFLDYPYKSFIFENLNFVQEVTLGKASKVDGQTKKVIRPATGIMALPNTRDHREVPGPKDFNMLNRKTKDFFKGVRNMPYHTLLTVHAGLFENESSPKGIKADIDSKTYDGFPDLYGQLKWKGGGLVDFYFFLERKKVGNKLIYKAYSQPHGKYEGRSKIQSMLSGDIDWTDKSLFDIVHGKLTEALKKAKEKK